MLQPLTEQGCSPTGGRFLIYVSHTFRDLEKLQPESKYFALFTAFDVISFETQYLKSVAGALVERGLAYACCWGQDCERWHDAIDSVDVERIESRHGDSHDVIMTSWHSKESLQEALWFFEFAAQPTEGYASECLDYIFAVPPEHEQAIRQSLIDAKLGAAFV